MIICEIGHNHLGDETYAKEYIDQLITSQPDGITFQYREPARYMGDLSAHRLSDAFFSEAIIRIHANNIQCGIALADADKLPFFEKRGIDFYKTLSKDISNVQLIKHIVATGKPTFISTGLSNAEEIMRTLNGCLPFRQNIRLIHTQLTYDPAEANMKAITVLRRMFQVPIAFGSHSTNEHILSLAVGFEPSDIFFYVRGNRGVTHPDHDHAIVLDCVPEIIRNIRELEKMLGTGEKRAMENEIKKSERL